MSSKFSIEAVVSMIDKVSGPMGRASKSVTGFSRKMRGQFASADMTAKNLNKRMNKVGGRAAKAGLVGLGVGAGLVAQQFIQFDDAIFAASAKFSDLDITTKAGQKTMEALRKTARKVGADTKFNAVQAAQGLDFLAMAGFNTQQAMKALPGVVSLATVANVDLARATDIASDTLNAFGLQTKNAIQLQKNLTRVNDVMAKTASSSNTTLEQLFEAVGKGGSQFRASGQSIETFSALAGVMANATLKSGEAGTQLRNIMLRIAAPTDKAKGMMDRLGITVQDSKGNFRDVIDILGDFEKGTKKMGDVQRAATLNTIFGARNINGMNILLASGSKELKKYRKQLEGSSGAADKMAKIIEKSMGNKIKALGSAATELGFKIFTAFAGDGKAGIDGMTKAIRSFDVTPIVNTLKVLFSILKFVFDLIGPFLPAILLIVAAIKIWAIAQAILNIIMMANPIFLIIGAVALLVAGFVYLVEKAGGVKNAFIEIGKTVMRFLLAPINLFLSAWIKVLGLLSKLPKVGKFFKSGADSLKGIQDGLNSTFESNIGKTGDKQPVAQQGGTIGANNQSINGRVDIGITGPKDTTVESTGIADPFRVKQLDQGFQG